MVLQRNKDSIEGSTLYAVTNAGWAREIFHWPSDRAFLESAGPKSTVTTWMHRQPVSCYSHSMQPLYCNVAADVTLMVTKYLVHEQASVLSRKAQWWKRLNSLQTWRELFPFGGGGGLTAVTLPFTETNIKSSSRLLLNIIWKISVAFNTKAWWWWWYLKQKRINLILFLVNYKGISRVWNSAQSKIHCRISKFWIPNENALIDTELWFLADVGFIFEYRAFEVIFNKETLVLGQLIFNIFLRSYWTTIIFFPHTSQI